MRSRSYSSASVGFCPTGWKGAKNAPKRSGRPPGPLVMSAPLAADGVDEPDEGGVDLVGRLLLHPVAGAVDDHVAPVVGRASRPSSTAGSSAAPGRRAPPMNSDGTSTLALGEVLGELPVAVEVAVPVDAAGEAGARRTRRRSGRARPGSASRAGRLGLGHAVDEAAAVVGEERRVGAAAALGGRRAAEHPPHRAWPGRRRARRRPRRAPGSRACRRTCRRRPGA